MQSFTPADSLHRLMKEALDSGAAGSIAEAKTMFEALQVGFSIAREETRDPHHQAALLTGVALARRVFLGGVHVAGDLDVPLLTPLPFGDTLQKAVRMLGGQPSELHPNAPVIAIGGRPQRGFSAFHVRTAWAGWRGGILPIHSELAPAPATAMPLAPMLAAALAVNEAFLFTRSQNSAFGKRAIGLSLWDPAPAVSWLDQLDVEPELAYLPSGLWLIGLGHLGQAYLWALGLLPYESPSALSLVLQDIDVITPSTESTSILSDVGIIGQRKTRAMSVWAERRGFSTKIYERLFGADFLRQAEEPVVALCGLDNVLGRRALDRVGFDLVIEAGIGRGYQDFRKIRLHTLPAPRPADDIWKTGDTVVSVEDRPAYQQLLKDGTLDRCGVTLLAGKGVGAPFVGSTAACLVLSEVLRLLHGGTAHQVIDLDLQGVEYRSTVAHPNSFHTLNPGFVAVN